ncbi:spermatogenesis-associated protein 6 isoform X1 [Trichomycterus rosablanca]|uniref:spermatogenesis-associated protein 6 isoform X1 n=1 Tax=Trichomycterus rosablanca TaxID=2290929 RepID=UPI002F34EFD1
MGGLTPPKKPSHSRVQQRALKCTVQLTLHAITCPGVLLHSQEDIYLSVRMMGQYHKSKCVPSAFPLLLHEEMLFSKIFSGAFDPGDIADHLENDATCFELIQLVPPEGEILATFEENTRDFLYPGPKLIPQSPGSEREILMKKSISFPGISPKVEFSTMSVIEECDLKASQSTCSPITTTPCHPRTSATTVNKTQSKTPKTSTGSPCGYQRPTVASQSRSLSPYTHRKMCQLSEEAIHRLRHLQIGPFTFKKELFPQQPFVVPCSPNSSLIECSTLSSAVTSSPKRISFHQKSARGDSMGVSRISPEKNSARFTRSPSYMRTPVHHSSPLSSSAREQSPLLTRSTLRERFQSPSSPSQSAEIHSRVQRILRTHSTRCRLSFEEKSKEQESGHKEPLESPHNLFCDNQLQPKRDTTKEPSVHLDNGTFWTNKTARYTGKSHREVFEDSLGKIYKNLYKTHITAQTQ